LRKRKFKSRVSRKYISKGVARGKGREQLIDDPEAAEVDADHGFCVGRAGEGACFGYDFICKRCFSAFVQKYECRNAWGWMGT
jgi:hypothetical protein